MKINYFFPTSILISKNDELADQMLPVAKKYLSDSNLLTNTWGYKNTFSTSRGISDLPDVAPYKEFIKNEGYKYLTSLGYDTKDLEFTTQIFVSEMFENDHHGVHTHPNSILSGVLYLQVPEGSSPIVFDDPRPFRQFVALPKLEDTTNWERVHFVPEVGLFLMWESWLGHEVPKNYSKEGRITMVFNLGKVVN